MIKSSFDISVSATTLKAALELVDAVLLKYLDVASREELHDLVDIELKHSASFASVNDVDTRGFDITAYVRLKKQFDSL